MALLKFIYFMLCFTLVGCSMTSLGNASSVEKIKKKGNGILYVTMAKDNRLKDNYSYYSFDFKQVNKGVLFGTKSIAMAGMLYPSAFKIDSVNYYTKAYILPVGKYHIFRYRFGTNQGYLYYFTNMPFEIKEDEVTYLGNMELVTSEKKFFLSKKKVNIGIYYSYVNKSETDSVYFKHLYPQFGKYKFAFNELLSQ